MFLAVYESLALDSDAPDCYGNQQEDLVATRLTSLLWTVFLWFWTFTADYALCRLFPEIGWKATLTLFRLSGTRSSFSGLGLKIQHCFLTGRAFYLSLPNLSDVESPICFGTGARVNCFSICCAKQKQHKMHFGVNWLNSRGWRYNPVCSSDQVIVLFISQACKQDSKIW